MSISIYRTNQGDVHKASVSGRRCRMVAAAQASNHTSLDANVSATYELKNFEKLIQFPHL